MLSELVAVRVIDGYNIELNFINKIIIYFEGNVKSIQFGDLHCD